MLPSPELISGRVQTLFSGLAAGKEAMFISPKVGAPSVFKRIVQDVIDEGTVISSVRKALYFLNVL